MSSENLTAIGDTIFNIVFGFFNNMISVLTGGAITDFLGGYNDLEGFWGDVEAWLITEMINGMQGIADFTQAAWIDNINTSHAGLMEILDLSAYIQGTYEDFYNESQGMADELTFNLERAYQRDRETGAALTDFAFRLLVDKQNQLEGFANIFYDSIYESEFGSSERLSVLGQESMTFITQYLAADLQAVEYLTDSEATAAAEAILAVAQQDAEFVQEWFLETVVKPISYGENMAWALSVSSEYDIVEVLEQLQEVMVLFHEQNLKQIEEQRGSGVE